MKLRECTGLMALVLVMCAGGNANAQCCKEKNRFSRVGLYTTWNDFFDESRMMDFKWFSKDQDVHQAAIGLNLEFAFNKKHSLALDGSFYHAEYDLAEGFAPMEGVESRDFLLARATYIRSWRPVRFFRLGGKLGGTYRKGNEKYVVMDVDGVRVDEAGLSDFGAHTGLVATLRLFKRISLQADLDYTVYLSKQTSASSRHHLGFSAGVGFAF